MQMNAWKSLSAVALAATLPLSAEAGLQRIDDAELSAVRGQLTLNIDASNTTYTEVSTAALLSSNPLLLPITLPLAVINGFTNGALTNAAALGTGAANVAFAPLFRPLTLAGQAVDTALDFLFLPISAPLDTAGNVFSALEDGVVGTATAILTAPINAVFGPINRAVDGVTGRAQATVDGIAYALLEVTGPLVANSFAGVSQAAGANGLNFTSRVFGRIAQAQAGRTAMRLDALETRNGY